MNVGHFLTAWTIRIALLCFVAVLGMTIARDANGVSVATRHWRVARMIWTAGCLFFVGHVAAAFQFYHHWSHQAAFDDTAKQTRELMGWQFGEGIYVSYVFLILWVADTVACWIAGEMYAMRPARVRWPVFAFMAFIAFNGTVIFKGGAVQMGGIIATLGLVSVAAWQWMREYASEKRSASERTESLPVTANSLGETDARYE